MREGNSHYSNDFKIKAVELSIQRGSVLKVAQELNVNRETLRNWKKQYKAGYLGGEPNKNVPNNKNGDSEELIRLRKELYEVKLERDILKKAVGIFSKSDR